MAERRPRGACSHCGKDSALTPAGLIWAHLNGQPDGWAKCSGSGQPPQGTPPAGRDLPHGALDSAVDGAAALDTSARTGRGRNLLAHALAQLHGDGWLRAAPAGGRTTDPELERLVLQAICDPGSFVPRGDDYTEAIPHWGMRAVFAALARADKTIVDYGSTVAGMARLLDQLRSTIDEFEHDPAQALACVREWLDGGREDPEYGMVAGPGHEELRSLERDLEQARAEMEEWKARALAAEAELEEIDPA